MSTIVVKIDTKKIDKNRLFVGEKGTYLDVVLIETPNDSYGNSHMVVQSVTKEEREAGVKGAILGNAKTLGGARTPMRAYAKPAPKHATAHDAWDSSDVPF